MRGVEPDFALVECFATGNNQCTLTGDCRLTGVLGGALQAFMLHLDGFTLADLLPGSGRTVPTVLRDQPRATHKHHF